MFASYHRGPRWTSSLVEFEPMRRRTILRGIGGTLAIATTGACVPPPSRERIAAEPERARVIQRLSARATVDGQGATLKRLFPGPQLRHLDPFVLLDDFDVRRPAGFPDHPHRGFEAFTYMIAGAFHHRDSLGNDSVIGPGGTQRFTSGRGARHSEMPAGEGSNRGLQLWVNLPQRLKQIDPSYVGTEGGAIPERPASEGLIGRVREVVGASSPVVLQTEVEYLDLDLLADSRFTHVVPGDHNAIVYVLEGRVALLGETLTRGQAILPSAGSITVVAEQPSRVLWLSGRPHGEPIRQRGPFVD
jgi:redox-sensitive bicupin YhaK (pirin superfamily)